MSFYRICLTIGYCQFCHSVFHVCGFRYHFRSHVERQRNISRLFRIRNNRRNIPQKRHRNVLDMRNTLSKSRPNLPLHLHRNRQNSSGTIHLL